MPTINYRLQEKNYKSIIDHRLSSLKADSYPYPSINISRIVVDVSAFSEGISQQRPVEAKSLFVKYISVGRVLSLQVIKRGIWILQLKIDRLLNYRLRKAGDRQSAFEYIFRHPTFVVGCRLISLHPRD